MTPELLVKWTFSIMGSGLAVCLLALGIRGTVRIFMGKYEEKQDEEYQPGHLKLPKVPPLPPVPPAKIAPWREGVKSCTFDE